MASLSSKKQKDIEACHFCMKWACGDCITKSFPYPLPDKDTKQQERGRICRVCETKFYIKQKLDEIFNRVDEKEKESEEVSRFIIKQQQQIS